MLLIMLSIMLVLLPQTLANVISVYSSYDDESTDDESRGQYGLWVAAVVAAYVFAIQTCMVVRNEYRHYRDLRVTFFVRGDPQVRCRAQHQQHQHLNGSRP